MPEPKHTPGPWRWTPEDTRDKDKLTGANGEPVLSPVSGWDKRDLGIRTGKWGLPQIDDGGKNASANAHLIAAAPDLLKALTDLIAVCEPNIYPQPDKPDSPWAKLQAARAAIAKATNPKE
jgi:hypothetical protein